MASDEEILGRADVDDLQAILAVTPADADEVAHAGSHAKEHDRCGSNLILPLLVSTTIGNTITRKLLRTRAIGVRGLVSALSIGAAVEVFSFSARNPGHPVSRLIHSVGHGMQSGFATREPSPGDLLVGRAAMEALLRAEGTG